MPKEEAYTTKELQSDYRLLKAQQDAFYAGKETEKYINAGIDSSIVVKDKYPTFADYINSLNK